MKKVLKLGAVLSFFLIFVSGCSNSSGEIPTISANADSEYTNTFKDLNLGILFDFDLELPNADKSWVNLWVERYKDGQKETEPIAHLSYGNSPHETEKGSLGFGMINPDLNDPLVFLYGPGVNIRPSIIKVESRADIFRTWDYAIGDEMVELELGETRILAVYRETKGSSSFSTVDLQDEESVNKMIQQDDMVLLLKIKIEKSEKLD